MTQKQFVRHFCGDVRLGNGQYTSKTYFLFNVKRGKSTGWSKKKKKREDLLLRWADCLFDSTVKGRRREDAMANRE